MPLWYYDKKELKNTPSFRDGIDSEIEARYRREGARFIIDCGTKLGLRYDTCATGVVFFHRFYMFHSFREFHRYVTAACCLFLAGKTEETPKKCKDIMKTTKTMLNDAQFMVFGDDPKEEVMTMERILLQTIKFDLMVEHPYAYLMKFAKMIKSKSESADKGKVHKLVQMGWTFINDSLCTMLCLQWEPEVIAVSLMYLASRLTKTDITDWQGKPTTFKGKWWEYLVEDVNLELLEDVCHQVLDLYSTAPKKREETPPPPPPKTPHPSTLTATTPSNSKRPRSPSSAEPHRSHSHSSGPPQSKIPRDDKRLPSPPSTFKDRDRAHSKQMSRSSSSTSKISRQSSYSSHTSSGPPTPAKPPLPVSSASTTYPQSNPYMSSQMYSSSFMTQEGSQSIQSLVGGRSAASTTYGAHQYPAAASTAHPPPVTKTSASYTQSYTPHKPPPPPQPAQTYQSGYQQPGYPQTTQASYTQTSGYSQQYTYPPGQYPPSGSSYQQPSASYTQRYPQTQQQSYSQQQQQQQQYSGTQYPGYSGQNYQNFGPTQSYQAPQTSQPPPPSQGKPPLPPTPQSNAGLGIRITSRQ